MHFLRALLATSFLTALLATMAGSGLAVETSQREKVAFIVEHLDVKAEIRGYLEEGRSVATAELEKLYPSELGEEMAEILDEELVKAIEESLDGYVSDVIDVYAEILDAEEVQAAHDFYTSPAGSSFGRKMPAISRRIYWIELKYSRRIAEVALERTWSRVERANP